MDFLFSAATQEKIAFLIVGGVAFYAGVGIFRSVFASTLAKLLLRRGRVKLAMRVRGMEKTAGCNSCSSQDQPTRRT